MIKVENIVKRWGSLEVLHGVSLEEAMDIFYNSPLLPLIEDGTADLHCRSDHYLAEEIWRERGK